MNVEKYLERIQCANVKAVSLENLRKLHSNHLLNISFENFSVALNQYVKMDIEAIYDKVVNKKRGGFCFELNQLFAWLLQKLGYNLKLVSCRTYPVSLQRYFPWFTHVAMLVNVNDVTYLSDIGFSFSFRYPLEFTVDKIQMDTVGHFKIERGEAFTTDGRLLENIFTLYRTVNDLNDSNLTWTLLFQFNTDAKQIGEFQEMLDWVQSSECARFYNRSFCIKHAASSLRMLVGYTLTEFQFQNGVEISQVETEISADKLHETIENELNINISREFVPRNIQ